MLRYICTFDQSTDVTFYLSGGNIVKSRYVVICLVLLVLFMYLLVSCSVGAKSAIVESPKLSIAAEESIS